MRCSPKSLSLAAALVALAAVPAASASLAGPVPGEPVPMAVVKVAECTRGPAPEDRMAAFRGAMSRFDGSVRMSMRFTLQERVGRGDWAKVSAPGLGVWRSSRPGVARFAYRQRVLALAEGSAYRAVVRFRWHRAGGRVFRRASRRSPACRQPGPLPNLLVARMGGRPAENRADVFRYAIHVTNQGRAPSPKTTVTVAVDGGTVDTAEVRAMEPGDTRRVVVSGPGCAASVRARVDPSDSVRESSERDNSRVANCPLGQ